MAGFLPSSQDLAMQVAYVQRAPEMDEQPYFSTTTTYIEAGATSAGPAAIAALYFGELKSYDLLSIKLHICRQDTYADHVLNVAAATGYANSGTSLGNFTFSSGTGTWTTIDLTSYKATLQEAPYIRLTHGSGSSTWSSFYKTGENAPYLTIECLGEITKTIRIYPIIDSDGIDGFLNGEECDFKTGYMYAGMTGSSSNNTYIACTAFDLSKIRYKYINSIYYSVKNVDGGSGGGNSVDLQAGITVEKVKAIGYAPNQLGVMPVALGTISKSVGTRTEFDLSGAIQGIQTDGLTYVYLGGLSSDVNNSYKEFGGPDSENEDDRPYLEINYTETNTVLFNNYPHEVFYCPDGEQWVWCVPYYSKDGQRWVECGL